MTVTTIYASNDGDLRSRSSTTQPSYSKAVLGSGSGQAFLAVSPEESGMNVGQLRPSASIWDVYQMFLAFDTSEIPDIDEISSVVLELVPRVTSLNRDFTIFAGAYDWDPLVGSSDDWHTPAELGALTPVASFDTTGMGTGSYVTYTSEAAFLSVPNLGTGTVQLILWSSRNEASDEPPSSGAGGTETVTHYGSVEVDPAELRPRLVITHQAAEEPVEEISSDLEVEVDLGGVLADVPLIVESVTGEIALEIDLEGVLEDVPLVVPSLTGSLEVVLDLSGVLDSLELPEIQASLPIIISLSGTFRKVRGGPVSSGVQGVYVYRARSSGAPRKRV